MFEIEKDVPVPSRGRTGFCASIRKVLSKMETGDSFAYTDKTKSKCLNQTVRTIALEMKIKVTVRALGDASEGKFRVWKL